MTLDYVKGGTVQKGEDGLAANGHSYERENWKWNLTAPMITTGKNSRKKKKLRSISSWSKMGKNFQNGTQKALAVEEKINKSEQIKFRNSSS